MTSIPLGQALLQRVALKLGGVDAAAARLNISPAVMRSFLNGTVMVPYSILLRAVDIELGDRNWDDDVAHG